MTDQTTAPGGVIEHSSLVGGSSAAKRLACPGSWKMEQKLPKTAKETSSDYAEEGSALHDCIAYMLDGGIVDVDEVRGMVFRDYVMTDDLVDKAIVPAMNFFDALCDASVARGEGEIEFLVEKRCEMPGIPGNICDIDGNVVGQGGSAFGTCDIIWRNEKRSGILDWKFGAGVPVAAIYPDDDKGDLLNPQLMFYGRAAKHTHPEFFEDRKDWPVEIIIYQPRVRSDQAVQQLPDQRALTSHIVADDDHTVTYAMTNVDEMEHYRWALVKAIAEAQGPNPKLEKGPHCRFAVCKAICPLWTAPVLDLTKLQNRKAIGDNTIAAMAKGATNVDFDWGQFYADALEYKEIAEAFFAEITSQAHQALESGFPVPGWKLVDKRPTENYIDEAGAIRHAITLGAKPDDVYAPRSAKSPAQLRDTVLEPLMKAKTKKERTELAKAEVAKFTQKVSSGKTLARDGDRRDPALTAAAAVKQLGAKLAELQGPAK